jgi:hypothetical protein
MNPADTSLADFIPDFVSIFHGFIGVGTPGNGSGAVAICLEINKSLVLSHQIIVPVRRFSGLSQPIPKPVPKWSPFFHASHCWNGTCYFGLRSQR